MLRIMPGGAGQQPGEDGPAPRPDTDAWRRSAADAHKPNDHSILATARKCGGRTEIEVPIARAGGSRAIAPRPAYRDPSSAGFDSSGSAVTGKAFTASTMPSATRSGSSRITRRSVGLVRKPVSRMSATVRGSRECS